MKSPSNLVVKITLPLLVVCGLVGGAIFFSRPFSGESKHPGSMVKEQPQHDAKLTETNRDQAAGDFAPIEFPEEMWRSAGLMVSPVELAPLPESVSLTGKVALNEDKLAHVFPLVDGRVDEVRVRFGQRVKKDDLLVVVQSKEVGQRMLQLFQDRLRLEFALSKDRWTQEIGKNTLTLIEMIRAGSSIDAIEQALKDRTMGEYREKLMSAYLASIKAQSHLERLTPLSGTGAIPARQILEAESDVNATKAGLQSLLEQISQDTIQATRLSAQTVKELQTTIAITETNLKILGFHEKDLQEIDPAEHGERLAHYPVTAPFDGTVISKDVVLLERVGPERQILTIADLSTVWVAADIYETHLPILAQLTDQKIRLKCDAWPGREFEATIFYTGDVVQESTRTLSLRAVADNGEGLLKPGMFVTIDLPNLNTSEVLQVPLSAIQDFEGRNFVFVQTKDGKFRRQDIVQGRRNREAVEVTSGIDKGDLVVTNGGFALKSRMLAELLAE